MTRDGNIRTPPKQIRNSTKPNTGVTFDEKRKKLVTLHSLSLSSPAPVESNKMSDESHASYIIVKHNV